MKTKLSIPEKIQSRSDGTHEYCIKIDAEARDYLHMYAAASNTAIDDIASCPVRVSDIYRRLTS